MTQALTQETFEDIGARIYSAHREKVLVKEELDQLKETYKGTGKYSVPRFPDLATAARYADLEAWRVEALDRIKPLAEELYNAGFPRNVWVKCEDIAIKLTGAGPEEAKVDVEPWDKSKGK